MFLNVAYDAICCQKLDCVALHTNLLVQQIEQSEATTDARTLTYMADLTYEKLCVATKAFAYCAG